MRDRAAVQAEEASGGRTLPFGMGLKLQNDEGGSMGKIYIATDGSFPREEFEVTANEGGHANAIQRVIGWLNDRLPAAIQKDHKLHAAGDEPPLAWFGKGGQDREQGDQ